MIDFNIAVDYLLILTIFIGKIYLSFSIDVYVIFWYEKICIKYTQFIFRLFFDIFYVSLKKSQLSIGHKVLFRSLS